MDIIKFLIDHPLTDPMARDNSNNTPLHLAAWNGHVSVVKYYIDKLYCDPNIIRGQYIRTPLHCANINGHIEMIKYIVLDNTIADPMATDDYKNTPLHLAAENGHFSVLKYYLSDLHIDPNI